MRDKQKTREGMRLFTGSETENLEKKLLGRRYRFSLLLSRKMRPLSLLSGPGYGLQS